MIKFFRKIRQNLLSKNKIGKYLLYAIGEIILVVIGILIALTLNKRSEQHKSEAKVDALFEDVLTELETDINNNTPLIYEYQKKDSLISLILNNHLTYTDYTDENSDDLWRVVMTRFAYTTSRQAYDVLMTNVDVIPKKYSDVLKYLSSLYNQHRYIVEEFNVFVKDLVDRNWTDFQENYEWYAAPEYRENKEAIDYRLHNYKYKNMVKRYRSEAIYTHGAYIEVYRLLAIVYYKEIATLLGKPLDSLNFMLDKKILEKYVGNYVNDTNPEETIELYIEQDYILAVKGLDNKDALPLMPLNSEKEFALFRKGITRFSSDNKGNTYISISEGHTPTRYTKIKP